MDPTVRDTLLLSARAARDAKVVNPSPASSAGTLLERMSLASALLHAQAQVSYLTAVVAEEEDHAPGKARRIVATAARDVAAIQLLEAAE